MSEIAPPAESVPPPTYVSTLPASFAVAVAPLTLSEAAARRRRVRVGRVRHGRSSSPVEVAL